MVVPHWCPKIGNQIHLDITRSKSCPHCKFAIHKLVFVSSPFVQYVLLAVVLSIVYFIYTLFIQDLFMIYLTSMILAIDFAFYCFVRYRIEVKKRECLLIQIQELSNWSMRKVWFNNSCQDCFEFYVEFLFLSISLKVLYGNLLPFLFIVWINSSQTLSVKIPFLKPL